MRYTYDESGSVVGFSLWNAGDTAWTDYYFIKNLQGDVMRVYRASDHAEVASYTYDAWGNILTKSGTIADLNPFRYRSYYYDNETYFYYLQSRYYDPAIGRFINKDVQVDVVNSLALNLFVYCLNNPINGSDPCGTCFHRWDFWNDCATCSNKTKEEKICDFVVDIITTSKTFLSVSATTFSSLDVYAGVGLGLRGSCEFIEAAEVSGGISYDVIGIRINDGEIKCTQNYYTGAELSVVFPLIDNTEVMYREFSFSQDLPPWTEDSGMSFPIFGAGAYACIGGSINIAFDFDYFFRQMEDIFK